ncbi:hypothetical protein FOA43_003980 [Brettanomyces nanus]|uniref:Uncharacterized protein n=1 Tax=Eeniella nana TaxID=13502 RepID=A0A875S6L1_EENNA|nr:uncharacterized protein FOA43_003980 [Brettanomyces nanus]QPG76588.1 hypothetical protein FOA43_003980 [Brettanomyces nanus]
MSKGCNRLLFSDICKRCWISKIVQGGRQLYPLTEVVSKLYYSSVSKPEASVAALPALETYSTTSFVSALKKQPEEIPEQYKFLAIQKTVRLFEERFVHDIACLLKDVGQKNIRAELAEILDHISITKIHSVSPSSYASRVISNKKLDEIYEEIMGEKPPQWIKQESRKRALLRNVLEESDANFNEYIKGLRDSIVPSIVEDSIERQRFLKLLARTQSLLASSSSIELLENSFNDLMVAYVSTSKPTIYAMRSQELSKFSYVVTTFLLDHLAVVSLDNLALLKSFYDEFLDSGYCLTHNEFNAYCVAVLGLKCDQLSILLDSVKRMRGAGIEPDRGYIKSILPAIHNCQDLYRVKEFIASDNDLVEKDLSAELWVRALQLCHEENDITWFVALMKEYTDNNYNVLDFQTRIMHQELLDCMLSFGFYSSARRILTALLSIQRDPMTSASTAHHQLAQNLIALGTVPKTYVCSNLIPTLKTFEPFFLYLSDFPGSKEEMCNLIDIMLDRRIPLSENIIWYILGNIGDFKGWKKVQLLDLIHEFLDMPPSKVTIRYPEFTRIHKLIEGYNFKYVPKKEVKKMSFTSGMTRTECLQMLSKSYFLR